MPDNEDEVIVLEHPDVKDDEGRPAPLVFRQSEGFWPDKLAQIEVLRGSGWGDAPKTRQRAAAAETAGVAEDKK